MTTDDNPNEETEPIEIAETDSGGRRTRGGRPAPKSSMKKRDGASDENAAAPPEKKIKFQESSEAEDADDNKDEKETHLVLLGSQPRGLYECDYCHADLTRSPRVRCATCPDFDLCLDCLATSDHAEMCQSRREFQRMHRRANEDAGGEGKKKKSKNGKRRLDEDEEDDPNILGYYHNGQWIPFFRHEASHGYVVADSARYMLFPPFRSVAGGGVEKKREKMEDVKVEGEAMEVDEKVGDATKDVTKGADPESESVKDETMNEESVKETLGGVKDDIDEAEIDVAKSNEKSAQDDKAEDERDAPKSNEKSAQDDKAEDSLKAEKEAPPMEIETTSPTKHESQPKKKTEFRLIEDLRNIWTIEEDLRLLDGILTCGLGNWPDIAEHVNGANGDAVSSGPVNIGSKTDKMCMERYIDDFLGRYGKILPPYTMVPVEGEEEQGESTETSEGGGGATLMSERKRLRRSFPVAVEDDSAPGFRKTRFRVVPTEELEDDDSVWPYPYLPPNVKLGDEVGRDLWYRSEQSFVRQCSSAASKLDVETIRKEFMERRAQGLEGYEANVLPPRLEDIKSYPGSELAGYMPRRGDFDLEHDNDAELLIADMEFSTEDTKADQDLKVEVIKIFNSKLDEREKRKQFIFDKKLVNYRENQENFQKLPADERHLIQRMRLFERFHSVEEHEAFVDKILKAKRLRKEIAKLQTYRRLGITSLADAEKYELDKSRREYHKMAWLKKEAELKKAEAEAARAAKENASDIGAVGLDGGIGAAANQSLAIWKQYQTQDSPRKRMRLNDEAENALDASEVNTEEKADSAAPDGDDTNTEELASKQDVFAIDDKPGFGLLSSKEKELCKRIRLFPQHYLDVKKALISESLAAGIWDPSSKAQKGKTFVTVDVSKRDDIIDFVLKAGWISSRPTVSTVGEKGGGS